MWFKNENSSYKEIVWNWWMHGWDFKTRITNKNLISHLRGPYWLLATMLCRLYGLTDSSLFEISSVSLKATMIEEGEIFNWEEILSSNIVKEVKAWNEALYDKLVGFFMSTYLLDAVCSSLHFPTMEFTMDGGSTPGSYLFHSNVGVKIQAFFLW